VHCLASKPLRSHFESPFGLRSWTWEIHGNRMGIHFRDHTSQTRSFNPACKKYLNDGNFVMRWLHSQMHLCRVAQSDAPMEGCSLTPARPDLFKQL
jgi:hypothetical protein